MLARWIQLVSWGEEAMPGLEVPTLKQEQMQKPIAKIIATEIYSWWACASAATLYPTIVKMIVVMSKVSMNTQSELFTCFTVRPKHVSWLTVTIHSQRQSQAEVTMWFYNARLHGFVGFDLLKSLYFLFHIIKYYTSEMLPSLARSTTTLSIITLLKKSELNQDMIDILSGFFEKSLLWVEEKYDKQSVRDAASMIRVKSGKIDGEIKWLHVLEGRCVVNRTVYSQNQFINFYPDEKSNITFQSGSTYAFLNQSDLQFIEKHYTFRFTKRMIKFLRRYLFYTSYVEDGAMEEFLKSVSVQELAYKSCVKWRGDEACQMAIVYKGVISIECRERRNIVISEITRGMLFMNISHATERGEISMAFPRQDLKYISKFKYLSKSSETQLILFPAQVLLSPPYSQHLPLLAKIKSQYEYYCESLKIRIVLDDENRLYRQKSSIKKQIKYTKEKVVYDNSEKLASKAGNERSKLYSSISVHGSSPDAHELSLSVISMPVSNSGQREATSSLASLHPSPSKNKIHNAWIEALNRKPKNAKSFSTLQNIHMQYRKRKNNSVEKSGRAKRETNFFPPEQFIRKNLQMKFEGLIPKVKNIDLSIIYPEESLTERVKKLQAQVDERRIVKLDKLKRRPLLLRDRVE